MTEPRPCPLFGINIDPTTEGLALAFTLARAADQAGADLIGIQDHPYNGGFVDTWTLLTALAMATQRIHVMANVSDLPLRPPAMLAKQAATLDLLSGGRVEVGLGAGAFTAAIHSYGGPVRSPRQAHEALAEAIEVMRRIWGQTGGERVSFDGRYYRLHEAQPGPSPAHPIRIWLGAMRPRSLRLTGRRADGWTVSNGYTTDSEVKAMQALIDEGAVQAGRDPTAIRRNYNLAGVIWPTLAPSVHLRAFAGSPRGWVDELERAYVELRMDSFIFWPLFGDHERQIRRFLEEVMPRARERLSASR